MRIQDHTKTKKHTKIHKLYSNNDYPFAEINPQKLQLFELVHMESCDVSSLFHSLQIETFLFNFANMPGYHLVGSCTGLHCGVSEIPEGYRL